MTLTSSPFDVLGLPETATPQEARRAFRRLAFRYHPDRNQNDPAAAESFLAIKEAFEQLSSPDPDAGFDADRVAAQMQQAAAEAERRRGRRGGDGRAWQQVHVALTQPMALRLRDALGSREALVGVGLAAVAALALTLAGLVPTWVGALVALAVGGGTVAHAVRAATDTAWAVETHWQGLRDLRWDVLLSWDEICDLGEGEGLLDLSLTDAAAQRLAPLVPAEVLPAPTVYRLPVRDVARLASVIRFHQAG